MTDQADVAHLRFDLEVCAREPIHTPGAIQPHGCLLAFDPSSLIVQQVSANVEDFLGLSPAALLNRPVTERLPPQTNQALLQALSSPQQDRFFSLNVQGRPLDALLHEHEGIAILEIEQAATHPLNAVLDEPVRELTTIDNLPALFQATAQSVRQLTGFDRVVLYRFDDDGHGKVISEAKAEDVDSYLGLHYPESDIPRQARALYLRQWIRSIPDALYTPVPLVSGLRADADPTLEPALEPALDHASDPASDSTLGPVHDPAHDPALHLALDLTHSVLRSISAVHLQYMANMGVRASMSMSLIVHGRLWGLISCGDRLARDIPHELRRRCETLARVVSLQINALATVEAQAKQSSKADAMLLLVEALQHADAHGLAGLPAQADALLHVTQSAGAAVVSGDSVMCIGSCPPADALQRLSRWVVEHAGGDGLFSTRQLSLDEPEWASCADVASGVLAFVLPTPLHSCVLWFRPEIIHTVGWGGNPNKPVEPAQASEGTVLHPRRSFELWKEEVRGRSVPWDASEIQAASDLRRSTIEIDLYRQVRREQEATKARDDLVAVVAHDLRTPMSVVVMQSAVIQRLLAQDASERGKRMRASAQIVGRAGERMSSLLNDLLDLAKIEAGRFEIMTSRQGAAPIIQDAYELLQSVCQARHLTLVPHPPMPDLPIQADPERIFQVLSNLIVNAVKFSSDGGEIHLKAVPIAGKLCEFSVSDRGAGIAPEHLLRVFDRYWQEKPARSGGAGLGLYISRGIVEAHGGTIRAESRPGHGSTMFFTVPLDLD